MGDTAGGGVGGGGGGKAGSGAGAGLPADASGGLGLGGGFDPTGGMGGGFGSSMGTGFDPTSMDMFGGLGDPTGSLGAQAAIQGPTGTTQPPITDQPSVGGAPQPTAPQPPPQPLTQPDQIGGALMRGYHPPQFGLGARTDVAGPTSTPGTQVASTQWLDQDTRDPATATDPSDSSFRESNVGGLPKLPPMPPTPQQQIDTRFPQNDPWSQTFADPNAPKDLDPQGGTGGGIRQSDVGGMPKLPPEPTQTATDPAATATPPITGPGIYSGLPASTPATPALTPDTTGQPGTAGGGQVTPPGTPAPAGTAPQSPLEQLVSGFMHMLMGGGHGGMGGLEQLIGRMFGMNPRQMFPAYYGGNPFYRPAGPGQFPPGTVGGRQIGPGAAARPGPRVPQAPGQTPPSGPGTPQAPQTPRTALAPRRPGENQPLPWPGEQGPQQGDATGQSNQLPPWPDNQGRQGAIPGFEQGAGQNVPGGSISSQIRIQPGSFGSRSMPSGRPSQPNVDRSQFRSQLAQNPRLIGKLAWMVNGEIGKNASPQAKIVQLETAFNRAQMRGQSLDHVLLTRGQAGERGYYANDTFRRNAMPSAAEVEQFKRDVLGPVMNGSNMSDVGWGPMTGNASDAPGNPVASNQMKHQLGYRFGGGEYYFREGPFRPLPTMQ